MTTTTEVTCPKCSGPVWDNRSTKTNQRAPDFKCKDKGCDGVIWPPKPGQRSPVSQPPAQQKVAHSAGPLIPGMDDMPYAPSETGAAPTDGLGVDFAAINRLNKQFTLYDTCLAHAHASATRLFGKDVTDEAVAAMAATLFIQASK